MFVGYVRVSSETDRQNFDLQRDALIAVGVDYMALLFVGVACVAQTHDLGGQLASRLWVAALTATMIAIMCWSRGIYSHANNSFTRFQPALLTLAWLEGCGIALLAAQAVVMLSALHADQWTWSNLAPASSPLNLIIAELATLLSSRYLTSSLATKNVTAHRADNSGAMSRHILGCKA